MFSSSLRRIFRDSVHCRRNVARCPTEISADERNHHRLKHLWIFRRSLVEDARVTSQDKNQLQGAWINCNAVVGADVKNLLSIEKYRHTWDSFTKQEKSELQWDRTSVIVTGTEAISGWVLFSQGDDLQSGNPEDTIVATVLTEDSKLASLTIRRSELDAFRRLHVLSDIKYLSKNELDQKMRTNVLSSMSVKKQIAMMFYPFAEREGGKTRGVIDVRVGGLSVPVVVYTGGTSDFAQKFAGAGVIEMQQSWLEQGELAKNTYIFPTLCMSLMRGQDELRPFAPKIPPDYTRFSDAWFLNENGCKEVCSLLRTQWSHLIYSNPIKEYPTLSMFSDCDLSLDDMIELSKQDRKRGDRSLELLVQLGLYDD